MLNSIRISIKDTLVYGLGNIAVKIIGLLLIPLYTNPKYFSVEEFGILGILEISSIVLISVMTSPLHQSFARWFWDKEHKSNQEGIFFMSFVTQLTVSLIFCSILIPLSKILSIVLFSNSNWTEAIVFMIIASGIQSLNNSINSLIRLQSKSVLFTTTNLLKLAIVLTLTIYFIVTKKMGLEGIYLAQVIGNSIIVLLLIGYLIKNSRVFFDFSLFKSMSLYGLPLILANISAVALNVIDRYTLNSLTVLKSVALYTLAFKITNVLKLVIADSVRLSLSPMIFKKMDSPDNKRFYSKSLLYSSYVMMFGIIVVSMFSFEVIKIMTKSDEFWRAVIVIPVLSLSIFFVNMKDLTIHGLHIAKKSKIVGLIVLSATIVSIILNLLLIPIWDITGAAVATLLSQFFYYAVSYYFSQKSFFVPYEIRKIVMLFITGSILSFLSLILNDLELLPRLISKVFAILSFPFILYLINFYEPVELQSIKGFYNKWSNIRNFGKNIRSLRNITDEE